MPSPRSELAFSQVREDPDVEVAVLERLATRLGRPLRVLLVASGGCTALTLLARSEVAEVHALDPNPAQLNLLQLRAHAALHLDAVAQLELLGANPNQPDGLATSRYADLHDHLPEELGAWFAQRQEQVAFGLNRIGKFEGLFRELATELAARGLDVQGNPEAAIGSHLWRAVFAEVFSREGLVALFTERAVMYSNRQTFADHFAAVFAAALRRYQPEENPFLHQVLCDAYPQDPATWPRYMQPGALTSLRQRGLGDLYRHQGTMEADALKLFAGGRFDLIQTSNVTDWMPPGTMRALFARLVLDGLNPGGALLARRLNGDYVLVDELATFADVDKALSAELTEQDRSFFYQEVAIAYAPGGPA